MQKKGVVINEIQNFDPPTIVGDERTINNKIGSIAVKEIINDEKSISSVIYMLLLAEKFLKIKI